MPPEDDGPSGEHVVLPARERSHVVVRRARIEATSLASQGDPTPDPNVDARAEIEDSASKLAGCRISLAVNLGRRKSFQPQTGRDIETGEVLSS